MFDEVFNQNQHNSEGREEELCQEGALLSFGGQQVPTLLRSLRSIRKTSPSCPAAATPKSWFNKAQMIKIGLSQVCTESREAPSPSQSKAAPPKSQLSR